MLVWKTKCKITYNFSKTLENTYEGVQFSEVAVLQPATLLKINSFIERKQGFQRLIHKNLSHSFNLFDKWRQLFAFEYFDHSVNWIHLNGSFIAYFKRNISVTANIEQNFCLQIEQLLANCFIMFWTCRTLYYNH